MLGHFSWKDYSQGSDFSKFVLFWQKSKVTVKPITKRMCLCDGCNKPASTTKERGTQYCSNECIVKHCRYKSSNNLIQIYNQFRFETMNRYQLTLEWLHSPFFWVHERIGAVGPTTVWAQCRNFFLARPHLPSPHPLHKVL